ncbi:MAG: SDR family oxidoreductase [Alphaproteobacteria bacterium]|nr:SDR family oxidoreductase [Alphaproteobacteria bacterium]
MPHLFIFGLGYVGQHLGLRMLSKGWHVSGTTRSQELAQALCKQGFNAIVWDGHSTLPKTLFKKDAHILITIPPNEDGDIVLKSFDFFKMEAKWIGYLSATSVYGDYGGEWVTEDSLLKPNSSRGFQRVLAEMQWLSLKDIMSDFPIHIFRLSGIYGPGRSVLENIKLGTAQRIDKLGHVFSRIHIEDIVSILTKSLSTPTAGEIYNLADDEPSSSADVVAFGCQILGVESPPLIPFEAAKIPSAMKEFYDEHKRVANGKIKKLLGSGLIYPTYREGLKHC